MIQLKADLSELNNKIARFAQATGRAAEDIARQAMKSMVRFAIDYTPPGSASSTGLAAKRRGEAAVTRDLHLMGFEPVQIKGRKVYTDTFWGHKLKKRLVIPTKINPKFADPDAIHKARLLASKKPGRRGVASRGGKQAWYVDKRLFAALKTRLFGEVGRLASGWVRAAKQLGMNVPAWIARHSETFGRGTDVRTRVVNHVVTLTVVNSFPDTANDVYEDTIRRVPYWTFYATENLDRQLRAKLAGAWGK